MHAMAPETHAPFGSFGRMIPPHCVPSHPSPVRVREVDTLIGIFRPVFRGTTESKALCRSDSSFSPRGPARCLAVATPPFHPGPMRAKSFDALTGFFWPVLCFRGTWDNRISAPFGRGDSSTSFTSRPVPPLLPTPLPPARMNSGALRLSGRNFGGASLAVGRRDSPLELGRKSPSDLWPVWLVFMAGE
jgi:hypothetical protein